MKFSLLCGLCLVASGVAHSQVDSSATDQQVYNWKVVAPRVEVQQAVQPTISIDPAARSIFERASNLYSNLKTWRLKWRETSVDGESDADAPTDKTVVFDRVGRVRIEDPQGQESLIIVDGKMRYGLDTSALKEGEPATYTREPVEAGDEFDALNELTLAGNESLDLLESLLDEDNPLDAEVVRRRVRILKQQSFSARVLPPQPFGGGTCDLVRLTTRYTAPYTTSSGGNTEQRTFWFARSDGRLVRWQITLPGGKANPTSSDAQVQTQEFNPTLSDQEFKFVPPKGAVLSK